MTLAEEMIAYRAENGISQAELARMCCIDRAEVLYIENGKRKPRATTEYKIRKVIGGNNGRTDNE